MPEVRVSSLRELLTELGGDDEFRREYRKQKPYYDVQFEILKRRRALGISQVELRTY